MPTAKKLPSGSWRCRVFSHYEIGKDGKKRGVYESFTVKDPSRRGKRECERMAAEWAISHEDRDVLEMTVQEAIGKYIDAKEKVLSPATTNSYKQILRTAVDDIRHYAIGDLTLPIVQAWVNALYVRTSAKYVRNANALFGASVKFFGGPAFPVTLPAPKAYIPHVPDDGEITALIDYIVSTTHEDTRRNMQPRKELYIAVLLSAFGSLRRGEICALKAEDFDMAAHTVRVTKDVVKDQFGLWTTKPVPKTDTSNRVVDLPGFVCDAVAAMDSYQRGGTIIKGTPDQISNRFRRAVRFSGAARFRFHDLRHYYVSIAHALGVPDAYIMEMGGWRTETTMKRVYRATLADRKRAERDKLTGHFDRLNAGRGAG